MKMKCFAAAAAILLLPFAAAHAQSYPNMVPSTSQIAFANPDGTPLFPGQTGQAQVTFTIENGPITFKTHDVFCITNPGGKEYMAECDYVTMDAGCTGTWQTGISAPSHIRFWPMATTTAAT